MLFTIYTYLTFLLIVVLSILLGKVPVFPALVGLILIDHLFYRQVWLTNVPPPTTFTSDFDRYLVELGRRKAGESELMICSLLRDGEGGVESSWNKILMMSKLFRSIRVYLFENDSIDNGRKRWLHLRTIAPKNVHIDLVNPQTFALNEPEVHVNWIERTRVSLSGQKVTDERRITKMCFLRNQCLRFLRSRVNQKDFVLITDMDIKGETPDPRGILNTIGYLTKFENIDIVSFRGTMKGSGVYFDPFAFQTIDGSENGFVQLLSSVTDSQDIPFHRGLFRCRSTFSGGIFLRGDRLERCSYEPRPLAFGFMECEHISLCQKFKEVFVNTNMIMEVESH